MAEAFALEPRDPATPTGLSRIVLRSAGLVGAIVELLLEARRGPTSAGAFAGRARRTARRILDGHGVTVATIGPKPGGAVVLVTNHVSYLDALVVSSLVPCVSIAKSETRDWPLIGAGLEGLGALFVQRGSAHSGAMVLRRALRALRAGSPVLNFPEGTTSDGRSVGPFRRGVFGLARLAGVPVVAARLSYDDGRVPWFGGAAFAPHYARLCCIRRLTATVHFAEPITVGAADDPERVASRAREIVLSLPVH